jgi:hypothetical protein
MSSLTQAEKDRIVHLWAERQRGLSDAEMGELCLLAKRLLMRTRLPKQYDDQEERIDLINDYILERIIKNQKAGPLVSAHALHTYLERFAIDRLRETARYPSRLLDENTTASDNTDDETGERDEATTSLATTQHQLLVEAGIDPANATESAQRFVAALAAAERAYLALNTCSDKDKYQPISTIAKRMQLGSSYHYKAKQLGITGDKGGFYQGYEHTLIGQWLVSLGARISPEWRRELMLLIVILCQQVLEHCREECA